MSNILIEGYWEGDSLGEEGERAVHFWLVCLAAAVQRGGATDSLDWSRLHGGRELLLLPRGAVILRVQRMTPE